MARYAAYDLDFDDEMQDLLGEVELDDRYMLHILSAEAEGRERLEEAVDEINGKEELIVKLPPSEEDDDEDISSLRKEAVARTDRRFFDAIQDNLKRWHNMILIAE